MKLKEGRISQRNIDLSNWKHIPEVIYEKNPGSMIIGKPHNIKIKPL